MPLESAVPAPVRKVEERMADLDPNSQRYKVMAALRQFRASWIDLGRILNEVVYGGDWKEWGYDDFEVYCARELGLKKPTVQKLMISYNYMKKYETKRLTDYEDGDRSADSGIPDFQTVELLDRVRRQDAVPADRVKELHDRAFDGEGEEPEFRRELRLMLTPRADASSDRQVARRAELAQILKASRELRRRLSESMVVPGGLRERLERALTELEALE